MVEWLPDRIGDYDPYNFFHTLAGPILLRCTSEFEIASSRLALGVRPVFVTGWLTSQRACSGRLGQGDSPEAKGDEGGGRLSCREVRNRVVVKILLSVRGRGPLL